jgi:hypothetical protein
MYIPVQENQQILKGVFITLIKLPQHVSAANCYHQGVWPAALESTVADRTN